MALAARVTELKGFLNDAEKRITDASDFVEEKTCLVEELRKSSLQETVDHTKALKNLQDEVVGLKQTLHDSLHQTMRDVPEFLERVMQ